MPRPLTDLPYLDWWILVHEHLNRICGGPEVCRYCELGAEPDDVDFRHDLVGLTLHDPRPADVIHIQIRIR